MKLKDHYNEMWERSLQQFKRRQFQYDDWIDAPNDTRYGLTLLARPSEEVKRAVLDTLDELKAVAPGQYYYPASSLHLTVLSIISCYPEFRLSAVDPTEYCDLISRAIRLIKPFSVTFEGLTASPSCILVQGFPADEQLSLLRDNIRSAFKRSSLQHSIDQRYRLKTAHLTALRFRQPLRDSEMFVDRITRLRDAGFGSCRIDSLELVANDWYHRKDRVRHIYTFELAF